MLGDTDFHSPLSAPYVRRLASLAGEFRILITKYVCIYMHIYIYIHIYMYIYVYIDILQTNILYLFYVLIATLLKTISYQESYHL